MRAGFLATGTANVAGTWSAFFTGTPRAARVLACFSSSAFRALTSRDTSASSRPLNPATSLATLPAWVRRLPMTPSASRLMEAGSSLQLTRSKHTAAASTRTSVVQRMRVEGAYLSRSALPANGRW